MKDLIEGIKHANNKQRVCLLLSLPILLPCVVLGFFKDIIECGLAIGGMIHDEFCEWVQK